MPFRLIFRTIFFAVLLVMFNPKLSAQFIQQGPKLRGTGSVGLAQQGSAIAISADGNTAIVGGRADYGYNGAAWVFTRTAGVWSQQGIKLSGSGGIGTSSQGYSVAISSDGNTAIVGGFNDNIGTGAAWIFTRNAGVWTQQGSKLVGTGAIGNAQQGGSVSISSDGNTVVIGGSNDNAGIGAAWVFTRSAGIWSQQGSKIVGSGAVGNSEQGKVSISGDGTTLVIGGRYDNNGIGAVWIFTRSGTVWSQQGSKLVGTGAIGQSIQGYSVSISADGNTAITGGYLDGGGIGAAWVFTRSGSVWTQQGSKIVGTGANGNAQQGSAVSISADGNTMIVGGQYDNFSNTPFSNGASWVFTRSGGIWTQQGTKLVGSGAEGFEYFGSAVALSSDGNTAIVGGTGDNNNGAAWIFIRSGGSWSQQGSKLLGSGGIGNSIQGYSVAISSDGNTAIVGGPGDNNGIGAAWIYSRSGGVWVQQGAKLIGSGAVGAAGQGRSVSLSSDGNTAIIGGDNDNTNKGAVWIFTRSGSVWTQQGSKLVGTGGIGLSYQGNSVSISADGNSIIVGGYNDNSGLGASWIYSRSGGVWTQQGSKLVGTGAVGNPNQGFSVSMSADGNTAIVGGNTDNISGAVWVFSRSGGVWTQQGAKLSCTGAVGYPFFGSSISLSANGNKFISAGFADNDNHGAAWIFTRTGGTWTQEGSKLVGSGNNGTAAQGWSVSLAADGNTAFVGGKEDQNGSGAVWVYNVPAPVITNFSPTSGPIGTSVTITGTGFNTIPSNNVVFFGATKAIVTVASATSLTVTVPSGATYENISVTNLGVNLTAYSAKPFIVTLAGSITFAAKQDKVTATEPYETCISDIDGDGKPDIAVTNNSSNSVSVLRNTSVSGTVSVAAKVDFATGINPQSLTAGDIDGDGKPDLVLVNNGSNTVSILRNTATSGTVTFAAKVDLSTGVSSGPAAVRISDLDADGRPDLVVANSNTNTVSVFLNTSAVGTISFATKIDLATGALPYYVSISDIDGDGKPDISVTNFSGSSFSVFRNTSLTGLISFTAKVDFATGAGTQPYGISAADLDGDGKPDITISIASSNRVSVFRNTSVVGTVSFATKIDLATAPGPYQVNAGDIDGDGKPDLAVATSDAVSKVSVLKNTSVIGTISFATKTDLVTGAYSNFVSIADIDGDGRPDLVANNSGSNSVSILQQLSLQPVITSFSPLSGPVGTTVTITGTGFSTTASSNIVYFGAAKATVTAASASSLTVTVPTGSTYEPVTVTSAIVNLTAFSDKIFNVTFNCGGVVDANSFEAKVDFPVGNNPYSIIAGDIDVDGKTDLAVANSASAASVLKNISSTGVINSGSIAAQVNFSNGSSPFEIQLMDIDGDGKKDMIISNNNGNSFTLYRNISVSGTLNAGSFGTQINIPTGNNPAGIALNDIDKDGKPDIVAINSQAPLSVSVFKNISTAGNISFASRVDFSLPWQGFNIKIGDIDGDSKPDIVVSLNQTGQIQILRNTTVQGIIDNTSFAAAVTFAGASGSRDPGIADFDGDGKPDMVVPNQGANNFSLFRNLSTPGTLSFAPRVDISSVSNPISAKASDIDGDGKPDILIMGSSTAQVFKNNSNTGNFSFAAGVSFTVGTNAFQAVVVDIDGDGKPEICAANYSNNTISILRNRISSIPAFNVTGGGSYCSGGAGVSVGLNNSQPGFTYQLKLNGSTNIGSPVAGTGNAIPFGNQSLPGTYTVEAIAVGGCTSSMNGTALVVVNPLPTLGVSVSPSATVCTGTSVTLSGTGASSYTWSGGVTNAVPFVPTTTTTYTLIGTDMNGCSNTTTQQVTVNICPVTLNTKIFIQGYYQNLQSTTAMDNFGAGGCLYMTGGSANANDVDYVNVSLMSAANGTLVESQIGILHTDGNLSVVFTTATANSNYYIRIRHRNSIETWSGEPVTLSTVTSYDFTDAANKAYGSNQVEVVPGIWAIYSGDIIDSEINTPGVQDGVIESSDYSLMENDVYNVTGGYVPADITGDGVVESADYSIMENNVYLVISVMRPF